MARQQLTYQEIMAQRPRRHPVQPLPQPLVTNEEWEALELEELAPPPAPQPAQP